MEATTADVLAGRVHCSRCGGELKPGQDVVETLRAVRGVVAAQFVCHSCSAVTMVDLTDPEAWTARRG